MLRTLNLSGRPEPPKPEFTGHAAEFKKILKLLVLITFLIWAYRACTTPDLETEQHRASKEYQRHMDSVNATAEAIVRAGER